MDCSFGAHTGAVRGFATMEGLWVVEGLAVVAGSVAGAAVGQVVGRSARASIVMLLQAAQRLQVQESIVLELGVRVWGAAGRA